MSASDESWHKVPWHLCQPRFYKAGWSIGNHCKGDYPGKDDAHSVGAEAHRILPELHEVHCQVDSGGKTPVVQNERGRDHEEAVH